MNEDLLFPKLAPAQVESLLPFGREVCLESGETLFTEGDPENEFFVLTEGELRVTKQIGGGETTLRVHKSGDFTGALSLFNDGISIATGRAVRRCRLIGIDRDGFGKILAAYPQVAATILFAMAERRPEAEILTQQREKLTALGKLSAGLAHELNNPAAAARRATGQLRETLRTLQPLTLTLGGYCQAPGTREWLTQLASELSEHRPAPGADDPLARSDREDSMSGWLDAHGVPDGWDLAPTLIEAGLDEAQLEALALRVGDAALGDTLAWLAAVHASHDLSRQVEQSVGRISDLVGAIKEYSYMDQASRQEIDVHDGLESTLTILGHKLKAIEVTRDYDRSLPRLPAYGSELNQVWTNIIDNAADAMEGRGRLTIRTARENDCALVEIGDDGPGILPDVQTRIFEPFFTTKEIGHGTGLGLDISYRIIVGRHHGELCVESKPGDTRFQIRLPLNSQTA